jgi:hypothetical protein
LKELSEMKKPVGMKYLVETLKDLAKTRDLIEPKELVDGASCEGTDEAHKLPGVKESVKMKLIRQLT